MNHYWALEIAMLFKLSYTAFLLIATMMSDVYLFEAKITKNAWRELQEDARQLNEMASPWLRQRHR